MRAKEAQLQQSIRNPQSARSGVSDASNTTRGTKSAAREGSTGTSRGASPPSGSPLRESVPFATPPPVIAPAPVMTSVQTPISETPAAATKAYVLNG